jgi:hypothetical protein
MSTGASGTFGNLRNIAPSFIFVDIQFVVTTAKRPAHFTTDANPYKMLTYHSFPSVVVVVVLLLPSNITSIAWEPGKSRRISECSECSAYTAP